MNNFQDDDSIVGGSDSGPSSPSSTVSGTLPDLWNRASKRVKKTLYPADLVAEFRNLLIRWIVQFQIALIAVENKSFYRLLSLLSPTLAALLPIAGDTVRKWIIDKYDEYKSKIKQELHNNSISLIHISFDLWRSPNSIPLMAVVVHYTDKSLKNRKTMIALRRLSGSHGGENMGALLVDILKDFELIESLGYFVTDNASSNDVAIDYVLRTLLPVLTPTLRKQRRLRCFGHILNLASSSYLYGKDPDSFEIEIIVQTSLAREQKELEEWRKKGPIGRLHNIVVFIRRSPQRRETFLKIAGDTDEFRKLMLIQDNATRWNSVYSMIDRAMKKRGDIQLFVAQSQYEKEAYKRVDLDDQLSTEDWQILTEVLRHLKPFHALAVRMQSHAVDAHHGTLWEALPAIELLLKHVIAAQEDYRCGREIEPDETTKHIITSLDNCWGKLDEYYRAMDETPVYTAVIALHPGYRWKFLETLWTTDMQKEWLKTAKENVKALWETYKSNPVNTDLPGASSSIPIHEDDFDTFMKPPGFYRSTRTDNEYERYCAEEPQEEDYPLEWWGKNMKTSHASQEWPSTSCRYR